MATANQTAATTATDPQSVLSRLQADPPLIDLGKVKAKNAKKLKRGKVCVLTNDLDRHYQQIQVGVEGKHTPLYIVFEEKPRTKPKKKKKIDLMGLRIDRRKFKDSLKNGGISAKFL